MNSYHFFEIPLQMLIEETIEIIDMQCRGKLITPVQPESKLSRAR